MLVEFVTGLFASKTADGTPAQPRLAFDRSVVNQPAHAQFTEAVLRGNVYTLSTAAAGVTIAAANVYSASNPQPLVGIYNPTSSGKNAVILRAKHVWASGTAGAQGLVWAVSAAPSTGLTAAGVTNSAINNLNFGTASPMKQFVNAALTGITMSLLEFSGGPTTGALAANAMMTFYDYLDGSLIVPPGATAGLFAAAAGTSPIVAASIAWEEVYA